MAEQEHLYLFYGSDSFSPREELRRMRAGLDTEGNLAHNTHRFDARREAIKVEEVLAACNTASFFAEARLVIVEGLFERLGGARRRTSRPRKTAAADMTDADRLFDGLANLPPSTTAVFLEENVTKTMLEAFEPIGFVRNFPVLKPDALRVWAQRRAEAAGARMTPAAAARLAGLIDGHHLGELAQEVDKLAAYAGSRPIDVDDVDALVSVALQYQTWDLTDAVVSGRSDRALQVLQRMDDKDFPRQMMFAMIVRQYRQLMQVKAAQAEGLSDPEIGRQLGIGFPFPLSKLVDQARRYQPERLDVAYRRLFETDVAVKTGVMEIEVALEMLIVELSTMVGGTTAAGYRR
jgi:DNA polymerase-3 subunit delta